MKKLAVALTTQEEFDEYIRYAEKMWRKRIDWQDPRHYWCWSDYTYDTVLSLWDNFGYMCHKSIYKVISLKEAIGEKEDKGIIREIGHRIKKYKHKTLWREADYIKTEFSEWYKISDTGGETAFSDIRIFESQLVQLWFEPIEEPKRDWIDKAFEDYDSNKLLWKSKYAECFREAIEKHMPKVNEHDIDDWLLRIYWIDYKNTKWRMISDLKSKGLRSE